MPGSSATWVWQSAQLTHTGKRRRNNEDAILSRTGKCLWAVADGMGGHQEGELASQAITAALGAVDLGGPLSTQVDAVDDALLSVHDQLRCHAQGRGVGTTIGSTVVALVVQDEVAAALWAGDSRLYRLRDGRMEQITRDHNPVSDLLDSGAVSEEEALTTDTNVITRAVGGQSRLVLDVAVFDVRAYDTFLLCSDGLYRHLGCEALARELALERVGAAVDALLERALAGPASDNISLVVARAEPT